MKGDEFDPKGLIFEAYRIDGITKSECRTIFLDWALSIPIEADQKSMIQVLLDRYGCRWPSDERSFERRACFDFRPQTARRLAQS